MITPEMKLKEIAALPEFSGRGYMVGEMPGIPGKIAGNLKLGTMCGMMKTWNAESTAAGFEYVSQKAKAGKVFYDIWPEEERRKDPAKKRTGLAAFPLPKKSKFAVICAGGGYAMVCSMVEAFPLVKKLNEAGYAVFAVHYRVGKDAKAPAPMEDLAQVIRFILEHAEEFQVEKEGYAVGGFSAGGHLAASWGTKTLGYAHYHLPKPAVMWLSYPVITMTEKTHKGSRNCLLGKKADAGLVEAYSVEKQVTADYPPSYVWQFDQDNMVPIDNTKLLVEKLKECKVKHQYETFPGTAHGVGLGIGTPAEGWLERAIEFWEKEGSFI